MEDCKPCAFGHTSSAGAVSQYDCVPTIRSCPPGQGAPPDAVSEDQCGCLPGYGGGCHAAECPSDGGAPTTSQWQLAGFAHLHILNRLCHALLDFHNQSPFLPGSVCHWSSTYIPFAAGKTAAACTISCSHRCPRLLGYESASLLFLCLCPVPHECCNPQPQPVRQQRQPANFAVLAAGPPAAAPSPASPAASATAARKVQCLAIDVSPSTAALPAPITSVATQKRPSQSPIACASLGSGQRKD
jgi:hypothetical protein